MTPQENVDGRQLDRRLGWKRLALCRGMLVAGASCGFAVPVAGTLKIKLLGEHTKMMPTRRLTIQRR